MDESKRNKFIELCKEKNIEYGFINRLDFKNYILESYIKKIIDISKEINYFDFALEFFLELLENEKYSYVVDRIIEFAISLNNYSYAVKYKELDIKHNKYARYRASYEKMSEYCIEAKEYKKAIEYTLKAFNKADKVFDDDYYKKLSELHLLVKDYDNAIKYLDKLSRCKNSTYKTDAVLSLGHLYLNGHFEGFENEDKIVKISVSKAISYYKEIFDKDYYIGKIYYYGLGGEKINYKKASSYFLQRCLGLELAECYFYGRGVEQSYSAALSKLMILDKKYHKDSNFLNMFFSCIEKTKQLVPDTTRKNVDAKNLYYKIKIDQGEEIDYLDFARINKDKLKYYSTKAEIKQDMIYGYTKLVEQLEKKSSLDEQNKKVYKEAIEVLYAKYYEPIKYQLMKIEEDNKNYYYFVGEKYYLGKGVKKDLEKSKYYFFKFVNYYENKELQDNLFNDDHYLFAYSLLNVDEEKLPILYKIKKYERGDMTYTKEVGIAFISGKGVMKDEPKGKEILCKYIKSIEQKMDYNNSYICKEYLYICDLLKIKSDHYIVIKALNNESCYYQKAAEICKLGTKLVKKNLDLANKFYGYILQDLERYVVETNPDLEKVKAYIKLFNELYPNGENRKFKFYLAYALFNNPRALFTIGVYYEFGDQVEKNLDKAMYYYHKAAELEYEPAIDKIKEFEYQKKKQENENKVDVIKAVRYIQLLELNEDEDITEEDIRNAYKQLSRIYHPDISNKRYIDGKKFVELKDAHDYLLKHIDQIRNLVTRYFK